MANISSLRSFNFNQDDLIFILSQIEFRALFTMDAAGSLAPVISGWDGTTAIYDQNGTSLYDPAKSYTAADVRALAQKAFANFGQVYDLNGKAIIGWDGSGAIYDAHGNQIWNGIATLNANGTLPAIEALAIFGPSYGTFNTGSSVTDIAGLRNVSGMFNNLNPDKAAWGAVDGLFAHDAAPHQGNYLQQDTGVPGAGPTLESRESISTTSADGPTTTGTIVLSNGRTVTYGYFDRTTTLADAISTITDGHHLLASSNQVDTTLSVSVTPMDAYTGKPSGASSAPVISTTTSTFLSGGELDPAYHPQFTAGNDPSNMATSDPAHYVPGLKDRVHIENNTDYSITFDPATKAKTEFSVIDYTPRMITQTTTQGGTPVQYLKVADPTAITHDPLNATSADGFAYNYNGGTGVVLLRDGLNHIVYWNKAAYNPDMVKVVEAGILAGTYSVSDLRTMTPGTSVGSDANGNPVGWNSDAYNYSKPIYDNNIDTRALIEGTSIVNTSVALLPGQADGTGGATSQGDANLYSGAGYGTLSMTGQHDKQNTDENSATGFGNHEYFYGNIASIGGNAPNNGWFALFGQFFDHGLDFIAKSGSYQIVVPLAVDDPLYGVIGQDGKPTTSITINRAIVAGPVQMTDPVTGQPQVDAAGKPVYIPSFQNHDSPYIDQSQTYGSQAAVDDILRNWVKDPNSGAWIMGDTLVDGHTVKPYTDAFGNTTTASLPTLNELRAEIRSHGGADVNGQRADLTWEDVSHGLRPRDAHGAVVTGAAAVEPLLLDMNPHFDQTHIAAAVAQVNAQFAGSGLPPLGFNPDGSLAGGLNALAPYINFADFSIQPSTFGAPAGSPLGPTLSSFAFTDAQHAALGELMMQAVGDHYIAGDGRANENVGLTTIHHVFHMEHAYQVQNIETYILGLDNQHLANSDAGHPHATAHDWQVAVGVKAGDPAVNPALVGIVDGHYEAVKGSAVARDTDGNFYVTSAVQATAAADPGHAFAGYVTDTLGNVLTADGSYTDVFGNIAWDQNKMFNAAKVTVEMEYQHIAVDQYSRAVSPNIQEFAGYAADKNADISLEFGQAAFRFGHSTLRETIDTMDPTGGITGKIMSYALEQAFLNPKLFAQIGPGSVALGMERQLMNEVDNFITPSMNEGLLGQPMDLGAINIARGRDVGMPTLNEAKTALGMKAYADWNDFGQQMVHPESLVNFIAAYSFDGDLVKAQTIVDLAGGAALASLSADEQAYAGTLGATYTDQFNYATAFMHGADKGIDKVDLWIGGLAELHVAGGVLGETFDTIFVTQIEKLMDGDRFYYLQRLVNQQFGNEIQNEQFKDLVERTTGVTNMNGNIFAYADHYYDEARTAKVATADLSDLTKLGDLYAGSKHDSTWHQVFKVDAADGKSGHWVDATGAFTATAPVAGAIFDLWGQEVVDLFDANGNKVFNRALMSWTDPSFDPTLSAANAGKTLFVDKNTDMTTGLSPGSAVSGFFLVSLGADQHKYAQVLDAHATEANHFGSGKTADGANQDGVAIVDESSNTGVGIWSVGGATTQGNGQIHEHHFVLPLNDVLTTPGVVSPLAIPAGAIGGIDPSVIPGLHMSVDENFILDVRPNGSTVNKDGSLDTGADSAEVLVGTKFNDYIEMGIGDDTAYGGAGNDVIFGGKSNAGHNTIYGGDGNDFLFGGDAPDLIDGGKGDDWIWGNSSGSSVNGLDQLIGGDGNDHIFGGIGIDKIFGGNGDDYIYGGQDTDPTVFGGDGNDYINGNSGSDVLNGDGGDDIIDGGPGVDQLFGGSGDDILRPGPGVTSVGGNGGGGDVLIGGDSATGPNGQTTDTGFDFADYSQQIGTIGIVGDLANQALVSQLPKDKTPLPVGTPTATNTGDVWFEMEGIIGSKNADVLRGDSPTDPDSTVSHGDNWLIGGSGDDVFEGRGGNDVIVGGTIRLDTLIGTYKDVNGVQDTYTSYVDGASHRVAATSTLSGGLLDYVSAHGVAGVTYADHLTTLEKSGAYKDYFLGDGGTAVGTDTAAYSGARSNYKVTYVPFTNAHGNPIQAFQIQDLRPGSPDGTDLLVGIQKLSFGYNETTGAGTVVNIVDMLDAAPTLTTAALSAAFKENTATAVAGVQNNLTPVGTPIGTISAQHVLSASQLALGVTNPGTLTWSIANTDAYTAALFALTAAPAIVSGTTVSDTATLSFAKTPDFEALKAAGATMNAQGQIVLTVQVQISDGTSVAVQNETVVINNVDEKATGAIHFAGATVNGNTVTFAGSPGTLADPDVTGTPALTYHLSGTGAPASGLGFTGGNQASGIHTFQLAGTYAQPAPLPAATATSPESAFVGTSGNDIIVGTTGADVMVGLNGNDTYIVNNVDDLVIEGVNGGTDTVLSMLNAYTLTANVENLTFIGSGDFTGTGNALANTIIGGAGNDKFIATADNAQDTYIGGGGSDTVDYSAYTTALTVNFGIVNNGFVTLVGSGATPGTNDIIAGIQNFIGGSGNDTVVAARDNVANTFDGGGGNNTANYSAYAAGAGLTVDFTQATTLVVGSGTAVGNGQGANSAAAHSDTLTNFQNFVGGSGADYVTASADGGVHLYDGGLGTDTIDLSHLTANLNIDLRTTSAVGGTQTTIRNFENVVGGSGNDAVTVGSATSHFTGGAGTDTLVFASLAQIKNGASRDVFTDFTDNIDKIDLHAVDANGAMTGTPHFVFNEATAYWDGSGNEFAAGTGTTTLSTAGQIRYHDEKVGTATHTVLDLHTTNAAGGADHQIDLGVDVMFVAKTTTTAAQHQTIHGIDVIV
jgi:Ca2+-binding RTX toxin-like protein